VDHETTAIVELEDDQFKKVAGSICAEHERSVRLIVSLLERETRDRVANGMNDVCIGDPVFPCGTMNIHTRISYHENRGVHHRALVVGARVPNAAGTPPLSDVTNLSDETNLSDVALATSDNARTGVQTTRARV
jgi:hypothetical protein